MEARRVSEGASGVNVRFPRLRIGLPKCASHIHDLMIHAETLETFHRLRPGDRIEVRHQVKVGFRSWVSTTQGTVVSKDRRRHSLHFNRNFDDKVFSDLIILRRDDGELTTVTLDEFSEIRVLENASDREPARE
jgi:ribosomal protein L34